jgi:dTDP-4-dehydrorhamnose reductase
MRVLVTGSTGFIGSRVIDALHARGHTPIGAARTEKPGRHGPAPFVSLHLEHPHSLAPLLDDARPDTILHVAAERDMPACEREPQRARLVNLESTRAIAHWCARQRVRLVFASTDQVFDGFKGDYREDDVRRPLNVYGTTKALAEDAVLDAAEINTVARIALTMGHSVERTRSPNEFVVSNLRAGKPVTMFANEVRTPVHVDCVARCLADLATNPAVPKLPRIHLAGPDTVTRLDMGRMVARAFGLPENLLIEGSYTPQPGMLLRATNTALNTQLARSVLPAPPIGMVEMVHLLAKSELPPNS